MKTIRKALSILESFTVETPLLGVTEIATNLGYQKSTTHQILTTLRGEGYIIHDPKTRKYCLGYKFLELSKRISYRMDLRTLARPIMEELSTFLEEDIALNILVEGRRLCVELAESRSFVRQFVPLGQPLPLHSSAAGKAMLAFLSKDQVAAIVDQYGLPSFTVNTITDGHALEVQLANVRDQGYAESYEEYGRDAASIAFPLIGNDGSVLGSLSIQSTVNRLIEENKAQFIAHGSAAATRINELLHSRG